jgi:hypothetical protein
MDKGSSKKLKQLLQEADNPQAGKAAPYGSGYAKVKQAIHELVKEVLSEKVKGTDGKACWKGYRYGGTENGKDICIKVNKSK